MIVVRNIIYIVVFAAGALIGGVFPAYIAQYQQRLDAKYEQVTDDLGPFQEIANRYHGGSMAALIDYHLASTDRTFHDEGVAIRRMVLSEAQLADSRAAFDASLFEKAAFLLLDPDIELAKATWDSFTPAFVTTRDALVFAAAFGAFILVLFYLSLLLIRTKGRRLTKQA